METTLNHVQLNAKVSSYTHIINKMLIIFTILQCTPLNTTITSNRRLNLTQRQL